MDDGGRRNLISVKSYGHAMKDEGFIEEENAMELANLSSIKHQEHTVECVFNMGYCCYYLFFIHLQ
jgi:hypothetical protein